MVNLLKEYAVEAFRLTALQQEMYNRKLYSWPQETILGNTVKQQSKAQ